MKVQELKVTKRETFGKKDTKQLRREEKVPCVIYGNGVNEHFVTDEVNFKHIIYTPSVSLLKITEEKSGKVYDAVLKEVQYHPVTDNILHVDFYAIDPKKPFEINIPIKITGTAPGVIAGGKLRVIRRTLKVKGLAEFMPDELLVDISGLQIGQGVKIRTLNYENLTILEPQDDNVASVAMSRTAVKGVGGENGEAEEATEDSAE